MSQRWAALQDWAIGIDRRTGSLKVLGVLLVVLCLAAIGTVFALFNGVFTRYDAITVRLPVQSTAALPGSAVQYRDVSIGKVVGAARDAGDGTAVVTVHVQPGKLRTVPASVRGSVAPISVFGNQYVVLQAPDDAAGDAPTLRPGATVQALSTAPASSLQEAVTSIYRIEGALRPAELNAALTAVANALEGQGASLGQTAQIASVYLGQMQPLWDRSVQDLGLLVPVADQLATSSPDIIGLFGNSTTTAGTLTSNAEPLRRLLSGSAGFADQAEQLSTGIERPFSLVAAASGPFLQSVASRPDSIRQLLDGLDGFARAVVQAGTVDGRSAPYLQVRTSIRVQNAGNLATAALGGDADDIRAQLRAGLGADLVDPPTYTSSQVPTPTAQVPGSAAAAQRTGTPAADVLTIPVVPALPPQQERDAVGAITAAISGAQPLSADAASLLLSPLLSSLGQPR